ncbi:MAG TPA: SPASM domain-containing protein, partial [Candidatus Kryptobacter bacterium]|nr:SPASM domain-containing protein [Candidatus Kryptobacter bacterium]
GEPLLVENHDIVSYIVERGVREGYLFTAVTNGYSLDRYLDLIKPGMIQFLQITLDGTREVHDRSRVHRDSGRTFDRIMGNIDVALRTGVSICVRLNTAGGDRSEIRDLYAEFVRRGWAGTERFSAYSSRLRFPFTPSRIGSRAISPDGGEPSSLSDTSVLDRTGFVATRVTGDFACGTGKEVPGGGDGSDLGLWNRITKFFQGESWALFRIDYCGARTGMVVFDPNGDLYACLESVGRPEHRIGTFGGTLEIRKTELEKWRGWKFEDERCFSCKYALFCAGGCPALSVLWKDRDDSDRCDRFQVLFGHLVQTAYTEFSGGDHPRGKDAFDWKFQNHKQHRKETEDESG